jgi:Tol biopolymer transport system component
LRAFPAVLAIAACGGHPLPPTAAPPAISITIVVSEVGSLGAKLVVLDEHGDRRGDLLAPADVKVTDKSPAISPDGQQIVFESSRGGGTSLWIAPLSYDAVPVQLTSGATDAHPVWTPDGKAIVFDRATGAHVDLYRLTLADHHLEQLTSAPGDEVTPAVAADGTIYYCARSEHEAHLERRTPDGTVTRLTAGPADTAPALSPDGNWLAFSRPVEHHGTLDGELWLYELASGRAAPLVDVPVADESGPVWSPDGAYVFATSAVRSVESGATLFSSVIEVDLATRHARILQDRSGYIPRLTPAIAPHVLDRAALASDPEYVPALARIVSKAIAEQQR